MLSVTICYVIIKILILVMIKTFPSSLLKIVDEKVYFLSIKSIFLKNHRKNPLFQLSKRLYFYYVSGTF